MIQKHGPVFQAFLGTLLTWSLTAAGAAVVILFSGTQQRLLDASLGFAGGVMMAASYWSLLDPAIEIAEESKIYGERGEYSFIPVAVGFLLGAVFVFVTDIIISSTGVQPQNVILAMTNKNFNEKTANIPLIKVNKTRWNNDTTIEGFHDVNSQSGTLTRRKPTVNSISHDLDGSCRLHSDEECENSSSCTMKKKWKRILLLIVAVTVHNIPEGLAVGVGFGAIGNSASATFESARNLAIGIGIQNFPEGLAVSLPLKASGYSTWRSFWYGQLSGMVEPVFGVLGAVAVGLAQPLLPYALAFAAGAMIYVVVNDIVPEATSSGNSQLATWGCIFGFVVMMVLDVGLG